jgi:hypothetical protein
MDREIALGEVGGIEIEGPQQLLGLHDSDLRLCSRFATTTAASSFDKLRMRFLLR